ncbi:MAG: recombinase family protein [Alphaproteobacteria bacterium]
MKAIILARVSSKEQEEGHSLDAQVARLIEYGYKKKLDVIKEFVLIESSTQGQRKKFQEVIRFCKSQKETIAIVVDAVDRLQRSFKETVLLNELINKNKIELHFYRENLVIGKDSSPSNIMVWNIHVMLAQSYVLQLSENVKRSINHKIRNGEWSGKAPIGYLNMRDEHNKSHIYLDPERAPIIQRLFQEYSKGGCNFKDLAILADKWGLRSNTPAHKKLSPGTLYDVLANPFYCGEMLVKGERYPNCWFLKNCGRQQRMLDLDIIRNRLSTLKNLFCIEG